MLSEVLQRETSNQQFRTCERTALNTDKTWIKYGEVDPYFGVITNDEYRSTAITDRGRGEFFRSGDRYVESLMAILRELNPQFSPRSAMDFGCGVGRLAIPLARECSTVLGVDISPGMLSEARKNAADHGISNVEFTDEASGRHDLVHSYIVLQHIPPRRGLPIVRDLVSRVNPGGMIALQVPYRLAAWRRVRSSVVRVAPIIQRVNNLVNGRALNYPQLTMYCYSIPSLLQIFGEAGIDHIRLIPDSGAGPNFSSIIVYGWNRNK